MHAIILCGIQGSGKSSYARAHWFDTHVRLSLDLLHTRQREDVLLHACLAAKISFVVDNTNPSRAQRLRYLQLARASGYERIELYHFRSGLAAALERNARRSGKQRVPDIAVRGTLAKLETPTPDEGWDRIVVVEARIDGSYREELLQI